MSLYSGKGKKYSVSYVTNREEGKLGLFKEYFENLGIKELPESYGKLEEAVKSEASGN
jgi:hypothetical protein